MYRGASFACPACGGGLAPAHATLPMSGCSACGGMWLGPDAAVHVMQGLGDAVDSEIAKVSVDVARTSMVPVQDSGARGCPVCNALMSRVVIGDIILDSCVAHGTWFDRDEVKSVVKVCSKLRSKHASGNGPGGNDISAAGVVEGVAFVVVGTASVAWSGFVALVEAALTSTTDGSDDV